MLPRRPGVRRRNSGAASARRRPGRPRPRRARRRPTTRPSASYSVEAVKVLRPVDGRAPARPRRAPRRSPAARRPGRSSRPSTISRSSRSPAQPPMQSSAAQVTASDGARQVVDVGVEVLAGARVRRPGRARSGSRRPGRRPGRGRSAARRPRRGRCRRRSRSGNGCGPGRGTTPSPRAPRRPAPARPGRAPRRRPGLGDPGATDGRTVSGARRRCSSGRRPRGADRHRGVQRRRLAQGDPDRRPRPARFSRASRGDQRGERAGRPAAVAGRRRPAEPARARSGGAECSVIS